MMNFDELAQARREAAAATLRPISHEEAAALGERLFPVADDPWRERYFAFLAENPAAAIYHAQLPEGVEVLYAPGVNRGMWFLPEKGMGIIGARGLAVLAELTGGSR